MKGEKFKAWIPVAVIVALGAGLVFFNIKTTRVIDHGIPTDSAPGAKEDDTVKSRSVFTLFNSQGQLPEMRFINRKNREITLEAFRGSFVLLNIWATWCAPCREEMPALDRLQEKLGGPNFHVLPLSIDETHPSVIRKFYKDMGIKFLYVYHDPTGGTFSDLNLPGIPATILVDRKGHGIGYVVGPVEWDSPEVIQEIKSYLASGQV